MLGKTCASPDLQDKVDGESSLDLNTDLGDNCSTLKPPYPINHSLIYLLQLF